jgi:hypothetical protein
MEWITLANLIAQVGLPLALKIYANFQKGGTVTPEEIAELKALGAQTAQTQMRDAILRAGLNPDDPKAKALQDLVGGNPA